MSEESATNKRHKSKNPISPPRLSPGQQENLVTTTDVQETPTVEPTPVVGSSAAGADSQFQSVSTTINHTANDNEKITASDTYTVSNDNTAAAPLMAVSEEDDLAKRMSPANPAFVKEWKQKLKTGVAQHRASVFALADLLAEASNRLYKYDFKEAWKEAGFRNWTTVGNYIRVAQAQHLRKPEFQQYLPTSIGHLIDLANEEKWTAQDIKDCINAKVMFPDCTRDNLKKWIERQKPELKRKKADQKQDGQEQNGPQEDQHIYHAVFLVHVHRTLTKSDLNALIKLLADFRPEGKQDDPQPPRYVVARQIIESDVKYDFFDKWVNQDGIAMTGESRGWEAKDPGIIRRAEEAVHLEPWDDSLGIRPTDLV